MPSSYPENIPPIIQAVGRLQPASVLDIGFGRGKYGFLLKEYYGQIIERLDGIEIFSDYITLLQRNIYDTIYNRNALVLECLPEIKYSLILLLDIVEHWPKPETYKLLNHFVEAGSKIIISTPRSIGVQGAEFGNEWERHTTQWLPDDFKMYDRDDISNDCSFIYVLKGFKQNV